MLTHGLLGPSSGLGGVRSPLVQGSGGARGVGTARNSARSPSSVANLPSTKTKSEKDLQRDCRTFPVRLYEMVENETLRESPVVSWTPDGAGIVIHNEHLFLTEVLPKYRFRASKMASIQRNLNIYGFQRLIRGAYAGSYFHPKFYRGMPEEELCSVVRRTSKNSGDDDWGDKRAGIVRPLAKGHSSRDGASALISSGGSTPSDALSRSSSPTSPVPMLSHEDLRSSGVRLREGDVSRAPTPTPSGTTARVGGVAVMTPARGDNGGNVDSHHPVPLSAQGPESGDRPHVEMCRRRGARPPSATFKLDRVDRTIPFPYRLFDLVTQESQRSPEIVRWTPNGTGFVIEDETRFVQEVLPRYQFKASKIASIQRNLNIYGFQRLTRGPLAGSYVHPHFSRDMSLSNLALITRYGHVPEASSGKDHCSNKAGVEGAPKGDVEPCAETCASSQVGPKPTPSSRPTVAEDVVADAPSTSSAASDSGSSDGDPAGQNQAHRQPRQVQRQHDGLAGSRKRRAASAPDGVERAPPSSVRPRDAGAAGFAHDWSAVDDLVELQQPPPERRPEPCYVFDLDEMRLKDVMDRNYFKPNPARFPRKVLSPPCTREQKGQTLSAPEGVDFGSPTILMSSKRRRVVLENPRRYGGAVALLGASASTPLKIGRQDLQQTLRNLFPCSAGSDEETPLDRAYKSTATTCHRQATRQPETEIPVWQTRQRPSQVPNLLQHMAILAQGATNARFLPSPQA